MMACIHATWGTEKWLRPLGHGVLGGNGLNRKTREGKPPLGGLPNRKKEGKTDGLVVASFPELLDVEQAATNQEHSENKE